MVFAFPESENHFLYAMKRILHYFCLAAAFAGLLTGAGSCISSTGHHRGGYEPEVPEDPTRPGEGDVPSRDITLKVGYGDFYGQFYNNNSDNFLVYLYEGNTDAEGYFTGSAHMLTLDILLPKKGDLELKDGVYTCSDAAGPTFIFIPSYESKDEDGNPFLDGSTLYIQRDPKNYQTLAITDGSLIVRRLVTGQYTVEATIVAGGAEYTFHFKGEIPITDARPSELPKDIVMDNITRVEARDFGQVWDGIESTDYRDWVLYFYDKDAATTNEYTCVEILTQDKYKGELPEMKFTKVVQVGSPKDFVPGVIIGGFTDDDGYAWGTWYCKDTYAHYAATKGSLDIKREGSNYSFTFDFEDEEYDGTFKGSYTGKVDFTVEQQQSGKPRKAAGKTFVAPAARTITPAQSGQRARIAR
jgi:hypothetical protein